VKRFEGAFLAFAGKKDKRRAENQTLIPELPKEKAAHAICTPT